jgi:hypothetical protein
MDELVQFMKRAECMESTLLQRRHNAVRNWNTKKMIQNSPNTHNRNGIIVQVIHWNNYNITSPKGLILVNIQIHPE